MVIVKLIGGLGNQLFQYALGRKIADLNKVSLKLDISSFDTYYKLHKYSLSHLNVIEDIASSEDILRITGAKGFKSLYFSLREKFRPYFERSIVREKFFYFDENIFRVPKEVYLDGFWQSEKYFQDIRNTLLEEFMPKKLLTDESNSIAEQIVGNSQSVSLHIRRCDYFSNPHTRKTHGINLSNYYQIAAKKITQRIAGVHFFVFSDDPEWAKKNLKLNFPITFVSHNSAARNYEDLYLISLCKHHIIANSTFSWWGAWLCRNFEKVIFAPKAWFNSHKYETRDIIPDAWIKI